MTRDDIYKDNLLDQVLDSKDGKLPLQAELNAKVALGELIYVNEYVKADGTKVSGYYRRRVVY